MPANVAYVLKIKPSLVAPAVQAFYERDPIDLKVSGKISNVSTLMITAISFQLLLVHKIRHKISFCE